MEWASVFEDGEASACDCVTSMKGGMIEIGRCGSTNTHTFTPEIVGGGLLLPVALEDRVPLLAAGSPSPTLRIAPTALRRVTPPQTDETFDIWLSQKAPKLEWHKSKLGTLVQKRRGRGW